MNTNKRMAELYTERAAGKKHLFINKPNGESVEKGTDDPFYYDYKYIIKPEPEVIYCNKLKDGGVGVGYKTAENAKLLADKITHNYEYIAKRFTADE